MPEFLKTSPENPEFARVLDVARLRDLEEFSFEIAPGADEAASIARLMGAVELRKLRFAGRLTPRARGVWHLEGQLGATVVQTCVVSLDPVVTRIDQPVVRSFVPQPGGHAGEIVIAADEDDEVEPLGERIDLGLVAVEALALALPAYPRRPGAALARTVFAAPGVEPLDAQAVKPFAGLAALRDKLGKGS